MSYVTQEQLLALQGKIDALIDMISNRGETSVDALSIKDFIEKFSIVKSLMDTDTVTSMLNTIDELNEKIKDVQEAVNVPLSIANTEANKIMSLYSDDATKLALNIADVKLFKSSSYKSFRDLITYISNLKFDDKINELNSQIAFAKDLSQQILAQKDKIQEIISKLDEQDLLLQQMKDTNTTQDQQIDYVNNLIVEVEKQIENYAFFAEEFNKIYITARDFISVFDELQRKIQYIVDRDDALQKTIESIVGFMGGTFAELSNAADNLAAKIDGYTKDVMSWVNDSLMFVNEVKAYNLSLAGYNTQMESIKNNMDALKSEIDAIEV